MRVSRAIFLALLTVALAILLPMGTVVEVMFYHEGVNFMGTTDLIIYQLDFLSFSYPGIVFVFILWIFIAIIQALNLLLFSREMLSQLISWLVFLPLLIAQIYLPSLVLDLAIPNPILVSHVAEPNVLCSLPAALGLSLITLGNWQKGSSNQWTRIGYG
ncbi:MAG: hypothetical protein ACFFEL_03415 [Candidatus Thorarchaeota archaeon]